MIKTKMTRDGLVAYQTDPVVTVRLDKDETNDLFSKEVEYDKFDDHCEVAHLEISNRCNMSCEYCYTGQKDGEHLSLDDWKTIIDKLADYGVFQVSFGGGEPTMYPEWVELAQYVRSKGLNLAMTTNGTKLPEMSRIRPILKDLFNQVNISWHQNAEVVEKALMCLYGLEVPAGINYCFSKDMSADNHRVKWLAGKYMAEVLYLAYKPVIGDYENLIDPKLVYAAAKEASDAGIRVGVDGPCAGKCLMKKRFVDVDHLGHVFPCSFVRESLGNLLESSFNEIWSNRGTQDKCPYLDI